MVALRSGRTFRLRHHQRLISWQYFRLPTFERLGVDGTVSSAPVQCGGRKEVYSPVGRANRGKAEAGRLRQGTKAGARDSGRVKWTAVSRTPLRGICR